MFSYDALQHNIKALLPTDHTNTFKIRRVLPLIPIFVILALRWSDVRDVETNSRSNEEQRRRELCAAQFSSSAGDGMKTTHPDAAVAS